MFSVNFFRNFKLQEKEGPRKTRHLDFLDILLTAKDEDGNGLTLTEIRNEVDTFMFAGKDIKTGPIFLDLQIG